MTMNERFIDINMNFDHPDYPEESTLDAIVRKMSQDQVTDAVLTPLRPLIDFRFSACNDELHQAIAGHSNLVGLGIILPHHGPNEVERCIKDLGFKGIHLFPDLHWTILNLRRDIIDPVFAKAQELKIPIYLNTGRSDPWSNPGTVYDIAVRFPDVPIVMGHMWDTNLWPDAIVVARHCQNVYLEIPLLVTGAIKQAISEIGTDRLIVGSGYPESSPAAVRIMVAEYLDLSESEIQAVLYSNAKKLFGF